MIFLKSNSELDAMRKAGRITGEALVKAREALRPGMTTKALDEIIHDYITGQGAAPSFLGYGGFPGSACISINEEVIHGIPSAHRFIHEGDIVSIDVGAFIDGFHGDSAATVAVGRIDPKAQALLDVTEQSLYEGIKAAVAGNRVGDISSAVQKYVEARGYSLVRNYTGHGVGEKLHESPEVPNFGQPGRGPRLQPGMTIAIEPMVNQGTWQVKVLDNDWTVVTADRALSAHFEHTVAITDNGPEILTRV